MNSFATENEIKPQTQGQTACLTLNRVRNVFYNTNSRLKSQACKTALSPAWSSSVADPSHSPIERGQRHGPLRREKKKGINSIRIDRIGKKIRIKKEIRNEIKKQLKGQICVTQLKDTMTRNINQYKRGVDG